MAQTLTVGGNDTSIQLSTILTQDGQTVTTADFAAYGRGILTINPLSVASVEFVSFTSINPALGANGGVAGALRGLSFKGNNQIAGNQKFNPVGTPVIISFGTHNLLDIPSLVGANAFTGANDFTGGTITVPAPTLNSQATTKLYVDTAIASGGVPATTTALGLVKMSVSPVSAPSPIAVGQNDTRLPPSPGTSGGIVGYTSTTVVASSVLLTANALILGGGAGATPTPMASLGTTTTVLHGNAGGAPTFGAVVLTTDVSGVLPAANGGAGTSSYVGAITTNSSSTNQNFDTAFTCGFLPATITLYFKIDGETNGVVAFSRGVSYFNGVTLVNTYWAYEQAGSANPAFTWATAFTFNTDAPAAGVATGTPTIVITLSVLSISSTGFTIRAAYSGVAGSTTGHHTYFAVANM